MRSDTTIKLVSLGVGWYIGVLIALNIQLWRMYALSTIQPIGLNLMMAFVLVCITMVFITAIAIGAYLWKKLIEDMEKD